jgi:hypothetical protein
MDNSRYLLDHPRDFSRIRIVPKEEFAASVPIRAAFGRRGKRAMKSDASLSQIATVLETRLAACREKEAAHAEQEKRHREQRELYAAEAESLARSLEAFRAAAAEALDLAGRQLAAAPLPPDEEGSGKLYTARMVNRVLELRDSAEPFGVTAITAEVNQRYRNRLKEPLKTGQVSVVLRWMSRTGRLRLVRKGKPSREALYVKA